MINHKEDRDSLHFITLCDYVIYWKIQKSLIIPIWLSRWRLFAALEVLEPVVV